MTSRSSPSIRPTTARFAAVVLAVGYRVRSPRGTQFRRWAAMGNHTTRGGKDGKDIKMANWPTALDKFLRDAELPVRSEPARSDRESDQAERSGSDATTAVIGSAVSSL